LGEAIDLLPAPTPLYGPLYQGKTLAHQPFQPDPAALPSGS